jgi:CheY-like chemotaxis protein
MMDNKPYSQLSRLFYFTDSDFTKLMRKRIYNVLLIASDYDSFMLQMDGRIDELIFNEYVSLNLRYPPRFIHVSTEEDAFQNLEGGEIDLIITMFNPGEYNVFEQAKRIKAKYKAIPIVVLTPLNREVSQNVYQGDLSAIDYVFSWLGNSDILLAIIKLIEDRMNVENDIQEVGVQAILLVEDSIRFYSSYLPNIYKIIFLQSKAFQGEGLNEHQQMMRMRGRPKILLATNYEEAVMLFDKYKNNLLGIISDISYKRGGVQDKFAGIKFVEHIKAADEFMPILIQSSDRDQESLVNELKVGFIYKHSKSLLIELRNFIIGYFAFGDFVFIDPVTRHEIMRAADLKTLQDRMFEVPSASLEYHVSRNHFSKWLRARALFPLAELLKDLRPADFKDLEEIRNFVVDAIAMFRMNKSRGVIAQFNKDSFDEYLGFSRIGEGSVGGKARGLAFIDSLVKRNRIIDRWPNVMVTIPRTVVISTDIFDQFMEENDLHKIALSDMTDQEIFQYFIMARLPVSLVEDLHAYIRVVKTPIAVRSSSLLEDSHYQPFAGIYSTFMVPYVEKERTMIEMLSNTIKSVYASVYSRASKGYMAATMNVIDEEKMAVVLQEVCGTQYGDHFYPTFSGTARSINFYPIEPERPEQGIAVIAMGLGKYIVEGGQGLRFSPFYPKKVLQLSTPEMTLRETQKNFFALNLSPEAYHPSTDDSVNLLDLSIDDAEKDGSLKFISSTYDFENNMIRDGYGLNGKKVITFSNVLNHNIFPLADILKVCLEIGQREMKRPIEIEFAVNLDRPKGKHFLFNLLQIRPILDNREDSFIKIEDAPGDKAIIYSNAALGNGNIKDLYDFVYVKTENFHAANNAETAIIIGHLNERMIKEKRNYVLVGPGRWGSSDPWLGIPVKWTQISAARVIIESGLENYRIEPSQGTHFFQNLTSFRVGYFTINPFINDGIYDLDYLNSFPAFYEDDKIRHIRFEQPLVVKIDGKNNRGIVYKMGVT